VAHRAGLGAVRQERYSAPARHVILDYLPPPPLDPVPPLPPDPIPEPDPDPMPELEPDEPEPPLELPDPLRDCPWLPDPSMRSPGLTLPEDSRWPCDMPDEPDPLDPVPFPSVTLGEVPPLECCACEGSPVKASSPPATRATVNTCAVFM